MIKDTDTLNNYLAVIMLLALVAAELTPLTVRIVSCIRGVEFVAVNTDAQVCTSERH